MNWIEITVVADAEAAEAVCEVMSRYAPNAVSMEQLARDTVPGTEWTADGPLEPTVYVRAYLPNDHDGTEKRTKIEEGLWHLRQILPLPEPTFREIAPADWENAWKEGYQVLHLGPRLVIKPSWREYASRPGDVVLELDPGMAFGTGLHPTTQMCLQAIETHMPAGARVLDLGTGSGILAIAAAKLGAASVLGLDVDAAAVASARENALRNRVDGVVRIEAGSLNAVGARTFDFALVNILARTIIQLCEEGLGEKLEPGGRMALAGLIDAQEIEVREALGRIGFTVVDRVQEKDWVGLICRRLPRATG